MWIIYAFLSAFMLGFYDVFKKYYGDKCVEDEPIFIEFYKNEFRLSKNACKISYP